MYIFLILFIILDIDIIKSILTNPFKNTLNQNKDYSYILHFDKKQENFGCKNFVHFISNVRIEAYYRGNIYHCPGLSSNAIGFLRIVFGWTHFGSMDIKHWCYATDQTKQNEFIKMFENFNRTKVLKDQIKPIITAQYRKSENKKFFSYQLKYVNFTFH